MAGIQASVKRARWPGEAEALALAVEDEIAGCRAARSRVSGSAEPCSTGLRELDVIAAVRFASVYKGFDDLADFERELTLLTKRTAQAALRGGYRRSLSRPLSGRR